MALTSSQQPTTSPSAPATRSDSRPLPPVCCIPVSCSVLGSISAPATRLGSHLVSTRLLHPCFRPCQVQPQPLQSCQAPVSPFWLHSCFMSCHAAPVMPCQMKFSSRARGPVMCIHILAAVHNFNTRSCNQVSASPCLLHSCFFPCCASFLKRSLQQQGMSPIAILSTADCFTLSSSSQASFALFLYIDIYIYDQMPHIAARQIKNSLALNSFASTVDVWTGHLYISLPEGVPKQYACCNLQRKAVSCCAGISDSSAFHCSVSRVQTASSRPPAECQAQALGPHPARADIQGACSSPS